MSWEDIDFDLIVPGMITRGPALESFGDYLNNFLKAGQERYKMIKGEIYTLDPKLPDIDEWISGYVRSSKPPVNIPQGESYFSDQFRSLIGLYKTIWDSSVFRTQDVISDPLNDEDYIITDTDLEQSFIDELGAGPGAEAWDIFNNYETMSLQQIFKASILQALYIVYKNTEVYQFRPTRTGTGSILESDPQYYPSVLPVNTFRVPQTTIGEGGSFTLSKEDFIDQKIQAEYNLAIITQVIGRVWSPSPYTYRVDNGFSSGSLVDGVRLGILQRDLTDNPVSGNFSYYFNLETNMRSDQVASGFENVITDRYDENYPFLHFNQDPIKTLPLNKDVEVGGDGSTNYYLYNADNRGKDLDIKDPLVTTYPSNFRYRFELILNTLYFVDLNRPELEFYIDPS